MGPQTGVEMDCYASGFNQEEMDEPNIMNLPRLKLGFNRKAFGPLKTLVETINGFFQ
jgi:hypothetical protein